MSNLTHAFFLAFRGKEVVLVRGTEESPDEWGIPVGILAGEPTPEEVEMILKGKYFVEIVVKTIREVKLVSLGKVDVGIDIDVGSMFIDTPIYGCDIVGTARLGPVFFAKRNNTSGLNIGERARVVLSSEYVQSRLH